MPNYFTKIGRVDSKFFLVGGTVRDVVCGKLSNDIDMVTTMPLRFLRKIVGPMYYQREPGNDKRGYIRIGGTPNSGDPFIDLKVFFGLAARN